MFKLSNGTKCYCDICGKEITDYSATENTFSLPLFSIDQDTNKYVIKHHCVDLCPVCKRWLAVKINYKMEDYNNVK